MIRDQIKQAIEQAFCCGAGSGRLPAFDLPTVEIARPKQADHGDYSSNVAMVAAAAMRKAGHASNPRAIAQAIADHVPADGPIGSVEIAGPGFINIRLADALAATAGERHRRGRRPTSATSTWATASAGRSNMSAPTRPGRSTMAARATPCWATRWRMCSKRPAMLCSASSMSTMPAPSSTSLPPRSTPATAQLFAAATSRSPRMATRANI